jgi:hypothetical protein
MKTNNYVRSLEGEINLYNTESQIMRFDPRRSRCHQAALSMCLAKRRPLYRPSTLYRLCVWSQQNSTDGRKWWPSCLWCVSIFLSLIWNLTSERKSYNVIIARILPLHQVSCWHAMWGTKQGVGVSLFLISFHWKGLDQDASLDLYLGGGGEYVTICHSAIATFITTYLTTPWIHWFCCQLLSSKTIFS